MAQKDCSDEVGLLLNLVRHHEHTIKKMFDTQEPILKYARAMRFICEHPEEVSCLEFPFYIDEIEDCIYAWEEHYGRAYKPDWEEA